MRFRAVISSAAILASVLTVQAAAGQSQAAAPMPGHVLERPPIPLGALRQRCPELGDDTYDRDVSQVGLCARLGISSLGVAGGRRWFAALFGRRWLMPASGGAPADTAAESELVLFTADASTRPGRDTLLTPVWHYRFEPEMLASVTPRVVSVVGGTLVGIDECVNGTGGCAQNFLLHRGGTWTVVRLAFLDSLNRRFPNAINHGYHVDLKTLEATAAVYSPEDANCCPSREAEMQLRLRESSLEIVRLRMRRLN